LEQLADWIGGDDVLHRYQNSKSKINFYFVTGLGLGFKGVLAKSVWSWIPPFTIPIVQGKELYFGTKTFHRGSLHFCSHGPQMKFPKTFQTFDDFLQLVW
jgi:hypothetical protein